MGHAPVTRWHRHDIPLSQPTVFERLHLLAIVARQINGLQFSKIILTRLLRFPALVMGFENMMLKPLDDRSRCPAAVEP